MKPSFLSTWAICCLTEVAGISTAGNSIRLALRIRVSMSAIGSVIMFQVLLACPRLRVGLVFLSPACFLDAGDESVARHVAEANTADAELAVHSPRPAAQAAAEADANPVPRPQLRFGRIAPRRFELRQLA